ncbi:MAG TPA: DUF2934 domain-containing protein [Opitutaceae bacterium]|nr:DUF2934 domain-containing protein [Opitutaceae bacterium]HRJ48060.1 DUF2934 domain-containing protein [Opitutaceae bacterium]
MKTTPAHEPTEAEIQKAAYYLWLESGCPEGRELEHWLAAKELLKHRHGRHAGRGHQKPTPRKVATIPPAPVA